MPDGRHARCHKTDNEPRAPCHKPEAESPCLHSSLFLTLVVARSSPVVYFVNSYRTLYIHLRAASAQHREATPASCRPQVCPGHFGEGQSVTSLRLRFPVSSHLVFLFSSRVSSSVVKWLARSHPIIQSFVTHTPCASSTGIPEGNADTHRTSSTRLIPRTLLTAWTSHLCYSRDSSRFLWVAKPDGTGTSGSQGGV